MAQPKLNQQEVAILSLLSGPEREAVETKLLAKKAEREVVVKRNREEFSVKLNANQNLVIRGLGNRFPMGIRPDSMQILIDNLAQIQAVMATVTKK